MEENNPKMAVERKYEAVLPNARVKFRAKDWNFIANALGKSNSEKDAIIQLAGDDDFIDSICDKKELFNSMLANRKELIDVTPQFFFYVGARKKLLEAGIKERETADYIASLLSVFSKTERVYTPIVKKEHYIADMLPKPDCIGAERFMRFKHVGDYALFYTGMFSDKIDYYHKYGKRLITTQDYIDLGAFGYKNASVQRIVHDKGLGSLLGQLSENFSSIRSSIEELKNEFLVIRGEEK